MNVNDRFLAIMNDFKKKVQPEIFLNEEFYAEWLAQTYYFVSHSTSLLGYALPHLKVKELKWHFEHHLGEEERHELLIVKDLEHLNRRVESYEEMPMTQAFYQSQYYRVAFEGGTSLLGYILYLEGIAVYMGKEVHHMIKDQYKKSGLFLKVHAEEDPEHLQQALAAIMKLSPSEQESILRNLEYSHAMYMEIIHCAMVKNSYKKAA